MSANRLPQHIRADEGATVTFFAPSRPSSTYTVSLYTDTGSAIFEGETATLGTVNTALNAAASRGDTAVTLADASNVVAGDVIMLAGPPEELLVLTTPAANSVTLSRPVLYDHANAVTAVSHKVTYAVNTTQAATRFWDGRLKWTLDSVSYYQDAICTEYAFYRAAKTQHLFDEEPKLLDLLDDETDAERLLDAGLAEVIKRVSSATRARAWAYTGPTQFIDATVYAALMKVYRSRPGDFNAELYERYRDELTAELKRIMGTAPRDTDQDGVVEQHEQKNARGGVLVRG